MNSKRMSVFSGVGSAVRRKARGTSLAGMARMSVRSRARWIDSSEKSAAWRRSAARR